MSLRRRMTLVVMAVTTVTLGGTFAAVSYTFNRQQQQQLDAELLAVASDEAREAPGLGFSFSDGPGPAANDVGPLTKLGVIFDEQGRVLGATPPFDQAPPSRASLPAAHRDCFDFTWRRLRLRAVLVPIPGFAGRELLLAASRDDLDGDERFLNRAMLVAFLAALIWVIAVAQWSVARLTEDHERIAVVTREVARGDLTARVSSSSSDAETRQFGGDIDQMIGNLQQLLATRDRLVMHAAHELRSPLTRLYGELQQALRKDRDAEGYRQAIERALPAARHLAVLIDDLLLLARLQGELRPDPLPVDLGRCVQESLGLLRDELDARKICVHIRGVEALVDGRERDLTRMVRNVLENAAAHAPEASTIEVTLDADARLVSLDISDQGPGVADEDRERIFEPFFRSRVSRSPSSRGAGLGLGIARDIARSHGGELRLLERSHSANFTIFRTTLPRHLRRPA